MWRIRAGEFLNPVMNSYNVEDQELFLEWVLRVPQKIERELFVLPMSFN